MKVIFLIWIQIIHILQEIIEAILNIVVEDKELDRGADNCEDTEKDSRGDIHIGEIHDEPTEILNVKVKWTSKDGSLHSEGIKMKPIKLYP